MSATNSSMVFDDLLDLLSEGSDPERLSAFQFSAAKQSRLEDLLDRNRMGNVTAEEIAELDSFERVEHVVRLLKARLRQQRGQ